MVCLVKTGAALFRMVPLRQAQAIGRIFGWLLWNVARFRRGQVRDALRASLPGRSARELEGIEARFYAHFGMTGVELLCLVGDPPRAKDWITVEGGEYLEAALREGKGALLLTGHIGNWELLGAACARLSLEVHAVVKRLHNAPLDDLMRRTRERMGLRTLPARESYGACLRVLREGGCLGMVLDQNVTRGEGIFVEFFGREACTTPGLAVLALRSGAPVVPVYALRGPGGAHVVRFCPPIRLDLRRGGDSLRLATQRCTLELEAIIRERPDQWLWFHNRWRTRPPPPPA